jgi:hypothetical protein
MSALLLNVLSAAHAAPSSHATLPEANAHSQSSAGWMSKGPYLRTMLRYLSFGEHAEVSAAGTQESEPGQMSKMMSLSARAVESADSNSDAIAECDPTWGCEESASWTLLLLLSIILLCVVVIYLLLRSKFKYVPESTAVIALGTLVVGSVYIYVCVCVCVYVCLCLRVR